MALSRFPRRKLLRQLYAMEAELVEWRYYFEAAAAGAAPGARQGAFDDRAAVVDEAAHRLIKAAEMLDNFPRIS